MTPLLNGRYLPSQIPMINDDIFFAPIRELAALLRAKKISSVDLTKACLERLERIGPKLGAVVTVTRDLALKQAEAADDELKAGKDRGLLHGIPCGVKDLLATKGIPTTWGAAPYKEQVLDYDATVVEKLREAGAVLTAKLAMVELAGGFGYNNADASFTGPGKTPWNTKFWAGGSSSGPGAAVAAGLVPFAIGSETSGSIITPCAFSGVSGLRPTYGRVSRAGAMALCWSLDKLGPMCRSADCCGIVLKAIAGADPKDPTSVAKPFEHPDELPKKKFRIGILKGATTAVMPAVKKNFEDAVKVLSKFADIDDKEVELPDLPFGPAVGTIVAAEGAAAFRDLIETGRTKELQNENDKSGGYAAMLISAVDYLQALRLRGRMKKAMALTYEKYDALIGPSRATVAPPIDKNFPDAYPKFGGGAGGVISAGNLVGQPAVAVPNGFGENDLPTGIQFTGKVWSEATLLAIARMYQKETDWHTKRPPV
jgi:aspartyl-tRNA(Asn)/glutamyl-tRNA(Gln) amidotransferase subunit A